MQKSLATIVSAIIVSVTPAAAWAQDASTQTQTQTPSPPPPSQTDTSSPLTPTDPNTSSPLTPSPINPVTGQNQQQSSAAAVQSSSEVPATFVQAPIETNRVDPSAPSNLQLEIDPSSSQAILLSPDQTQLAPTAAGVSLNSIQGTTSTTMPSSVGSSIGAPIATSIYPSAITEPAATQSFLNTLHQESMGGSLASQRVGSSSASTSMGPLIGSAAVKSSSPVESMSSGPTPTGGSTFMLSLRSSSIGSSTFVSPSIRPSSIGPSALRPAFYRGSSMSVHHVMSSSHRSRGTTKLSLR